MRPFLPDFINSLTTKTSQSIHDILESSKVDKAVLSRVSEKLAAGLALPTVALDNASLFDIVRSSLVQSNLREVSTATYSLFSAMNDISLLVDSHNAILHSQIKQLEDELSILEKALDNYAFLLSDAQSYDYSYLEAFNDSLMREDISWTPTDRASQTFNQDEIAAVDPVSGTLSIFDRLHNSYPMNVRVIADNHQSFIKTDTNTDLMLNDDSGKGWRRTVVTPAPLTSTLRSFVGLNNRSDYTGAQLVLEFVLAQPSPCDTFRITPFADGEMALTQIQVFPALNSNEHFNVLSDEVTINQEYTAYFPFQTVAKVRVFVRQPTYRRNISDSIPSEEDYRFLSSHFLDAIADDRSLSTSQLYRMGVLLRDIAYVARSTQKITPPQSGSDTDPTKQDLNRLLKELREYRTDLFLDNSDISGSKIMDILTTWGLRDVTGLFSSRFNPNKPNYLYFDTKGFDYFRNSGHGVKNPITVQSGNSFSDQVIPSNKTFSSTSLLMKYQYIIGIKSVAVGASARGHKAYFVSKTVPAPGDSGEVRLRASEVNFSAPNTVRDSSLLTSVEYSVTNVSVPRNETDWIPILSVGESSVVNERAFPDSRGKVFFRFPADSNENINIYKNGYLIDLSTLQSFIYSSGNQIVLGAQLNPSMYTTQDFLTCDYTPAGDATVVNFEASGFQSPPLVSAFDADGSGEGYRNSGGQLIVVLKNKPYIDYSQVDSSSYSETNGLSPYAPIVIRLSSGTLATNLTNYKGAIQSPLVPSSGLQFIHTDKTIMFNKPVNEPFRIFYQYLPSNLRFRAVLRCNNSDLISPKVDFVQLKSKTRKADAKRDM